MSALGFNACVFSTPVSANSGAYDYLVDPDGIVLGLSAPARRDRFMALDRPCLPLGCNVLEVFRSAAGSGCRDAARISALFSNKEGRERSDRGGNCMSDTRGTAACAAWLTFEDRNYVILTEVETSAARLRQTYLDDTLFRFRTLEQAKDVAAMIACFCPDRSVVAYGLKELMVNAIEHGNLGISFDEKTHLVHKGIWREEVKRRLELPANRQKYAQVHTWRSKNFLVIEIADEGKGFSWQSYLAPDASRLARGHGHGIVTARVAFSDMQYLKGGSVVRCKVEL